VKGVRAVVGGERPYEMKLRTFFALPVPDRVARPLSDCADTLYLYDRGLDAHWVDSANYHLTLCFTGEVTLDQVTELERSCRERLPHQRGFSLQLERLAYFKVNARLAILAALVGESEPLRALHRQLVEIARETGVRYDTRAFKPHITLARLPASNRFEVPDNWPNPELTLPVDSVVLFQSRSGERGAIYTPLFEVHLCASHQAQ
jgi:2''-5'' RNA ligase